MAKGMAGALAAALVTGLAALAQPVLAEQDEKVYLVARFDLDGTTYNQVVFFQDDVITDLKGCKREMMYGRNGNWQVYSHITNAVRGFTYSLSYTCALGRQDFSGWDKSGQLNPTHTYEVVIRDKVLQVTPRNSYSACLNRLRSAGGETAKQYCARSTQAIQ